MVADFIIAVIIGLGIYQGYTKGLLIELVTLLAFVIGLISAFKLLHNALEFSSRYVSSPTFALLLAFIVVFALVFTLILLLGKVLKKSITYSLLGAFDQSAGAIFGGLKASFALSMILWLMHQSGMDTLYTQYTKDAYIYPYLINFGPEFIGWISYVIPFRDIFPAIRNLLQTK